MTKYKTIIAFASLVQFVNMMDYMMVVPLGPDLAKALPVLNSDVGTICGCYTLAVAFSGLVLAGVLDRFDRRHVAMAAVAGLGISTLATTFSTGFYGLIGTRVLAGLCGGPAAGIALTMATEAVPQEHRGKAVAAVMGAFSVSSVVAVPFGLELARFGNWKSPFYAIFGLAMVVTLGIILFVPPLKEHLASQKKPVVQESTFKMVLSMFREKRKRNALLMMGSSMLSSFLIIPGIAAFFMYNRGFPRADLSLLYMVGGVVSLILVQLGGWLSDRFGPLSINFVGTVLLIIFTADGFMHESASPLMVIFVMFMAMACMRNVSATSEAAKVPRQHERAAFMSVLSAVQQAGNGLGGVISSMVLTSMANGALVGMGTVAGLSIVTALVQPYLLIRLYRRRPYMERA